MPDSPLVSILVPLYNAELYVEETICYALGQAYQNIELIIVDDGSTDSSYTKAAQFLDDPRVTLLRNPGKGACAARNEAYRHSKGKYIMFLDADDYCSNGKIDAQVLALENAPKGSVVFCPLARLSDGKLLPIKPRGIDHDYDKPVDMLIDMWTEGGGHNCPHCYLVPREVVDKAGGWDESVLKNQDGEFFSRVIAASSRMIFVPDEYAVWRLTNTGVSSKNSLDTMQSQLYTYKKIASVILSRDSSLRARKACAWQLGWFVYLTYPEGKIFMPEIHQILNTWEMPLEIPYKGKLFMILKCIVGWQLAAVIVKERSVIQFCSILSSLGNVMRRTS